MHALRTAAIVVAFAFASIAHAQAPAVPKTNITTDLTDIWWPDAEPGWGIQFVHNADIVFATLYVYGPAGEPTFYVAVLENTPIGGGTWTGTLYSTTGSHFAANWNPAAAGDTPIGTMTFTLSGIGAGTLAYNVGATNVIKFIKRQPLRAENNDDSYRIQHTWSTMGPGCGSADAYTAPASGGMEIFSVGDVPIVIIALREGSSPETCQMQATYSQVGRFGQYTGDIDCYPTGRTGTMMLYAVQNRPKMLTAEYTINWTGGCVRTGSLAAVSYTP